MLIISKNGRDNYMRYYRHLYIGEGLEKKKDKVISRLQRGKLQMDIYVITLAVNEHNSLEIYDSKLFLQPAFPYKDLFVVGITKGYEDAIELVEQITQEVYNKTQGADIRSYIMEREQEE